MAQLIPNFESDNLKDVLPTFGDSLGLKHSLELTLLANLFYNWYPRCRSQDPRRIRKISSDGDDRIVGDKNQNANKFLGLSTKPNKKSLDKNHPHTKKKKSHAETLETLTNIFCFINNITQNDCNFRLF